MAIEQSILEANRASLERMEFILSRLGDEDLARPLADNRTIATILGHAAFWDQRVIVLLKRGLSQGTAPSADIEEPENVDWINDALDAFLLRFEPRALAQFALESAREVNRMVEELPDEIVSMNSRTGNLINLARFQHREEHLDEIEEALEG